jgi:predicted nucleic acid-binding protein
VRWLLDTNVLSESVRAKPNSRVTGWIAAVPALETAISIVSLAELMDGAATMRDARRRERYSTWIETEIVVTFRDRVLPLTTGILIDWIALARGLRARGRTRDPADLLIAATARTHQLTVVTRNARHFIGTGVVVYDPWKDETHHSDAV